MKKSAVTQPNRAISIACFALATIAFFLMSAAAWRLLTTGTLRGIGGPELWTGCSYALAVTLSQLRGGGSANGRALFGGACSAIIAVAIVLTHASAFGAWEGWAVRAFAGSAVAFVAGFSGAFVGAKVGTAALTSLPRAKSSPQ